MVTVTIDPSHFTISVAHLETLAEDFFGHSLTGHNTGEKLEYGFEGDKEMAAIGGISVADHALACANGFGEVVNHPSWRLVK